MIENHDTQVESEIHRKSEVVMPPTQQIEQMLSYLFENFDTIQKLVEREKNRQEPIFGFKAGGIFNQTEKDVIFNKPQDIDLYSLPANEEKD